MPEHEAFDAEPGFTVPHVGGYRRVLPVSLERLYENALDWQHLPHVHQGQFASVSVIDAGAWGWRARVAAASGASQTLELRLDRRCRRWITRVLDGQGRGAEIWTHAFPMAERRVDIVVDFFVPGVAEGDRARVGKAYAALYAQLYDEDVAMMVTRQRELDRRIGGDQGEGGRHLELGPLASLDLPLTFTLRGREYVLARVQDQPVAFPRQCPHQFGPLDAGRLQGSVVTCPWHGYRFDVRTGDNLSGHACRLEHLPLVEVGDDGWVRVSVGGQD